MDIGKETLELIWAGVYDAVPHDDLHTMNPQNCKISVPEDRKFFLGGKDAQVQNAGSDGGAKSNWNLVSNSHGTGLEHGIPRPSEGCATTRPQLLTGV